MSRLPINEDDFLKIYTDGAARGNLGSAAYAFLLVNDNVIIHKGYGLIGDATNNTAEYNANINTLKAAEKFHRGHLKVFSDSNLAVQQINSRFSAI